MVSKTEVASMSFSIVTREKKMKSDCRFKFDDNFELDAVILLLTCGVVAPTQKECKIGVNKKCLRCGKVI